MSRDVRPDNRQPQANGWYALHTWLAHSGATVMAMLADGMTDAEILADYPDLELDDIREALRYAAAARIRRLPVGKDTSH